MEQCGWLSFVFCTMFKAPPHPRPTWLQFVYYHMQHQHPLPCHACTELWAEFSPFWEMPAPSLRWLSIGMWVTYTLRPHKSEGFQTFQTFRVHGVQTPPNQVHFMSAIKESVKKLKTSSSGKAPVWVRRNSCDSAQTTRYTPRLASRFEYNQWQPVSQQPQFF